MGLKDFSIKHLLGKGSYGSVYKVQRKSDKLEYAMKEVNIKQLNHREREEAVNEIRLLASVQHPNIIRYCEAFLERDSLYIVTDFASKGDLHKRIKKQKTKKRPFSEDVIWRYFAQICSGVQALHAKRVLHRDLKPKNIFLTQADGIQIGDLGCSKLNKKHFAKTQVGTPYYMSPEIWMRRPYNEKSDVWALGCLLYEMVAFHPPFLADDMNALSHKVRNCPPARYSGRWSSDMNGLITRLLSKDPARRPTVSEILAMSCVAKHVDAKAAPTGSNAMLKTIHVPRQMGRGMRMRNLNLPPSCYPGADEGGVSPRPEASPRPRASVASARPKAAAPSQALPQVQQKVPHRPTYAARPGAGAGQQKAGGMQPPARHGGYGGYGQQGHGAYGARPRYSEAAKVYNKRAGGHHHAPAYGQRAQAGHGHGQYHRARAYQARPTRAYRGW